MNVLIIIFAFMNAVGEAFEKNYVEPYMTMTTKQAFECSESIDRGGPCTECGSEWHPTSPQSSELVHRDDCNYIEFLNRID